MKMTNFLLITLWSFLFACILIVEASKGLPISKKKGNSSPTRFPKWFKGCEGLRKPGSWTIYGQWFHQRFSKPSGEIVELCSINEVQELWSFMAPKKLDQIKRIDLSVFRPGYTTDFNSYINHDSGYILSYNVSPGYIKMVDDSEANLDESESKRSSPLKMKRISKVSPSKSDLGSVRIFGSLIDEALRLPSSRIGEGEGDGEERSLDGGCSIDALLSDIFGFTLKRQYDLTLFQVFIDGRKCRNYIEAQETIKTLISGLAGTSLTNPRHYGLAAYSQRIISGSPHKPLVAMPATGASDIKEDEHELISSESEDLEDEVDEDDEIGEIEIDRDVVADDEREDDCDSDIDVSVTETIDIKSCAVPVMIDTENDEMKSPEAKDNFSAIENEESADDFIENGEVVDFSEIIAQSQESWILNRILLEKIELFFQLNSRELYQHFEAMLEKMTEI